VVEQQLLELQEQIILVVEVVDQEMLLVTLKMVALV
tara:strand:+ start:355 stop:462 length:108 start_codon:yes stop_codon:yes gene_type:complete